ncbi:MAG: YcgL domain-containing protein [Ketobacteraceae bacterium]|nr:YcgL domain-containing protein [Ketobacteraceae bacterium]
MIENEKILCSVYRSPRKEGMYVYVRKNEGVDNLPESLIRQFGTPGHVMDLLLTADRRLARVEVAEVMGAIREKGFYLQMPPREGLDF